MNKSVLLLPALSLLPAAVMAQSAFVGTWKADMKNGVQMPTKPRELLLANGTFECRSCVPVYKVPADGKDHAVSGQPYFDSAAVKVVDANTVEETDKKAGKTVLMRATKVSADGNTLMFDVTDSTATSGEPIKIKGESTRASKGPEGSHLLSGGWRMTKYTNFSDNGLLATYALEGSTLKMSTPTGQAYSAPLDGSDVPFSGDPGQTSISMKKVGDHTIDETDKRNGKVIGTAHLTVAPDGKSMKVAWKDVEHGTDGSFMMNKQ